MINIFEDNFSISNNSFIIKYITDLNIFALREYYLRNIEHFANASEKRNSDFFDIENLLHTLEFEISQRNQKKDLRLYLFEQNNSLIEDNFLDVVNTDLILDSSDKLQSLSNYDKIIGDIALYDINLENKYCAISYQIDFEFQKKGVMSLFIQELFSYIEKLNGDNLDFLKQIFAFVPIDNIKSQNFCIKNGFEYFTELENYAEINGIIKNHFVYVKNFDLNK